MSQFDVALPRLIDQVASVDTAYPVGGGCISDAAKVSVVYHDGQQKSLFVKSNDASFLDNFQCEWDGLVRLGEPGVIGVPKPIAVGEVDGQAYLTTEWIDQQPAGDKYFVDFGAALAELHQATLGQQIGLDRDNFLGAANQINSPCRSWPEFVAVHRIEFQLRWAVDQGMADAKLRRDCRQVIDSIERILDGRDDQTSLLHGDLWSGNYLCGSSGRPVIIDPAVYYGCREAEFGMLKLFGSCPPSFYDSYEQRFALPSGWQRRTNVYVLYHLLNHLNLFGSGYQSQCRSVAAEILSQ